MKSRNILYGLAALTSFLAAAPAMAVKFPCGPVSIGYLGLNQSGYIVTSVGDAPGPLLICSINATVDSITATQCQAVFSMLLTLKSTGRRVVYYFDSSSPSNGGITTCPGLDAWSVRVPYHFEIID